MAIDTLFTNGVIAVKEKSLLGDKINRLCEVGADEAFRILQECNFGGGEWESAYDYDRAVYADERSIDDFVREYATGNAELAYLLAPRDFHNAKALVKAESLGVAPDKMLAPDGLIPSALIAQCMKDGDFSPLSGEEGKIVANAITLSRERLSEEDCTGAEIGIIFERAKYSYLISACKKSKFLRSVIAKKIDMTNILTCLRSFDEKELSSGYITGGKIGLSQLYPLFCDSEKLDENLFGEDMRAFLRLCISAKKESLPLSSAERMRDSLEYSLLSDRRYELKKNQPFLYYVFKRRLENENVRIVFVCLLCGMDEREIKARLRGV
jgi:V/A-type H+-transporting ATPase subunit C